MMITEDVTENLVDALLKAEMDVCYVSLPISNKQIITETLFVEPLYVAISTRNPPGQQRSVSAQTLESLPFIMLHDDHCLRDQIEAFCLVRHINPQVVYRTSQLATVLDFVRLDLGTSLVPASAAVQYDKDDIACLRLKGHSPERVIVAASHSGRSDIEGSAAFNMALRESWQRLVGSVGLEKV